MRSFEIRFGHHFRCRHALEVGSDRVSRWIVLSCLGVLVNTTHRITLLYRNEGISTLMAIVEDKMPSIMEVDRIEEHLAGSVRLAVLALLHNNRDAHFVEVCLTEAHVFNLVVKNGEELINLDETFDFFVVEFARNNLAFHFFLAVDHFCGFVELTSLHVSHVNADEFLYAGGISGRKMLLKLRGDVEGIDILLLVTMAARRARCEEYCNAKKKEVR